VRGPFNRILLRGACHAFGVVVVAVCLYVLSYGPATLWVVSAVSGQQPTKLNASIYDARLNSFCLFYSPLIQFRSWLYFRVGPRSELLFLAYDDLFARPRRLADGRKIVTVPSYVPLQPDETVEHYVQQSLGFGSSLVPKAGAQLFALPLSRLILVVTAPGGDDDVWIMVGVCNWDPPWPAIYACLNAP